LSARFPTGGEILAARGFIGRKNLNGRGLCSWCGKEVEGRRRSWCSNQCVSDYRLAADWGVICAAVWQRDKGKCALCEIDTEALSAQHDRLFGCMPMTSPERDWLRSHGIPEGRSTGKFWDCDHIIPVIEGGGNGLENLRTLCIPCHKAETAALRKRMAKPKPEPTPEAAEVQMNLLCEEEAKAL